MFDSNAVYLHRPGKNLLRSSYIFSEMDLNNTENGSEERKKSLKNYTSKVLKESSLSALSNIVSTKNPYRKAYQILVLVLCFTGFFYQCFTLLSHIFRYPTIVDVRIENPDRVEMPALTFCDNNGISRKKFCSKLPHCCMEADDALCLKHPSYCNANETMMDLNIHRVRQHIVSRMLNEDQSTDGVKSASQSELKDMAKNGFQKCFDDLYKLWQKCVVTQGFYFEGG
ncbi:amiloride-sensitive sodium channel subunit alpha [Trichonephila clavipes]|nr:amiloride-sensitive sodium channel subunit alpha [Trichonephila clavipes]